MKNLRKGYTTGACAAAAAKAAAVWQVTGSCPGTIAIQLETESPVAFAVIPLKPFMCGIIKDAGDDPDVTDGCMVCAGISILDDRHDIVFKGGTGIGTITRPGLKLEVGEPAINPVPRQYIKKNVREVIGSLGAVITISIPQGEQLAKKTFNPRLGIEGGLSILGTTGIVNPMSEDAVKESLSLELSMHKAAGLQKIILCVSGSGERLFKQKYPQVTGIMQMSNYTGFVLDQCVRLGFSHALLFGGTGKLTKLAANIMNTHSHIAGAAREVICTHTALCGGDITLIQCLFHANTTREAEEILHRCGMDEVWQSIVEEGKKCCERYCRNNLQVEIILNGSKQNVLAVTQGAQGLLENILRKG